MRALLGLAGGALTPALAETAVAKKKRNKNAKPCAPCQQRKKGRCRGVKPNDTRCRECGVCADGVCVPSQIGCPICQVCAGDGRCTPAADDTPCPDNGKCLNGTCNPPPDFVGAFDECGEPDTLPCCSGFCRSIPGQGAFCAASAAGEPCFDTNDCSGEMTCIGYRCG